jgi:replicative DNA helicase
MPAGPDVAAKAARVPPHSEEAERGLLGSMLLDAERVVDLCIEGQIAPESFYVQWHRVLFELLVDMHNEGRPVDLLTVSERLRDLGRLDQAGGATYLEKLVDACPTPAHAEYYLDLVRQKCLLRRVIDTSREAIDACYAGEEDADGILDRVEQEFFNVSGMQRATMLPWANLIKDALGHIDQIIQLRKEVTGVPTGFNNLDRITRGMQGGDMVIIAARPSMGKTSLAMNIAEFVALGETADHEPRPVAVFSLEMSREAIVKRMLCSRAGVAAHKLSGGFVSQEQFQQLVHCADTLSRAKVFIDDTAGLSAVELRARARRLKRKYDIQLVVVDYLQMMNYPQFAKEGRQRETAAISGALKAMAKELRIPVIVLSQLSRAPETRDRLAIPKLSDLRDSGSIEQDADVVCLLRRPCMYPEDEEAQDKTLAIVDVAKQRNGPTGEVRLNFIGDLTRFQDRVEGVDQPAGFAPSSGEV